MNDTVAVVLPQWMVWLLALICVIQLIESVARLYVSWLRDRVKESSEKRQLRLILEAIKSSKETP
jgi:hypothetical protein